MSIPMPDTLPGPSAGDDVPCPTCIAGGIAEDEAGRVIAPPRYVVDPDWPTCDECAEELAEQAEIVAEGDR